MKWLTLHREAFTQWFVKPEIIVYIVFEACFYLLNFLIM